MNHDKMLKSLLHASKSTEYNYEFRKVLEQAYSTILSQSDEIASLRELIDEKTNIIEELLAGNEIP